ncbi:MAG: hypothetical protein JWN22_2102 [Nocardioides sp.]|jgi:hypothetical protein|nr:hypothetical protein [Nocardioides sp.]
MTRGLGLFALRMLLWSAARPGFPADDELQV